AGEDADAFDPDGPAGRGHPAELALVGPVPLPVAHDMVVDDELVEDGEVEVGDRAAKELVLVLHRRDPTVGTVLPLRVDVPEVGIEDPVGDGQNTLAPERSPELCNGSFVCRGHGSAPFLGLVRSVGHADRPCRLASSMAWNSFLLTMLVALSTMLRTVST